MANGQVWTRRVAVSAATLAFDSDYQCHFSLLVTLIYCRSGHPPCGKKQRRILRFACSRAASKYDGADRAQVLAHVAGEAGMVAASRSS